MGTKRNRKRRHEDASLTEKDATPGPSTTPVPISSVSCYSARPFVPRPRVFSLLLPSSTANLSSVCPFPAVPWPPRSQPVTILADALLLPASPLAPADLAAAQVHALRERHALRIDHDATEAHVRVAPRPRRRGRRRGPSVVGPCGGRGPWRGSWSWTSWWWWWADEAWASSWWGWWWGSGSGDARPVSGGMVVRVVDGIVVGVGVGVLVLVVKVVVVFVVIGDEAGGRVGLDGGGTEGRWIHVGRVVVAREDEGVRVRRVGWCGLTVGWWRRMAEVVGMYECVLGRIMSGRDRTDLK